VPRNVVRHERPLVTYRLVNYKQSLKEINLFIYANICQLRIKIVFPLKRLFEQTISIKERKLPNDWRSENISAIYKKGSKHDASNYRPISLT